MLKLWGNKELAKYRPVEADDQPEILTLTTAALAKHKAAASGGSVTINLLNINALQDIKKTEKTMKFTVCSLN